MGSVASSRRMPSLCRTAGCCDTWRLGQVATGSLELLEAGVAGGRPGCRRIRTRGREPAGVFRRDRPARYPRSPWPLDPPPGPRPRRASAGRGAGTREAAKWSVPPVLVRQVRNGIVEAVHRGRHRRGRRRRADAPRARRPRPDRQPSIGDEAVRPDRAAPGGRPTRVRPHRARSWRSWPPAIAARTSTSGRSRRCSGGSGSRSPCSPAAPKGMPLDALTAARLARDGERPQPVRHMCSGQHTRVHPAGQARRLGRSRRTGRTTIPRRPRSGEAIASCLRGRARPARDGHRRLRDPHLRVPAARGRPGVRDPGRPGGAPAGDPRAALAPYCSTIRDAMIAHPEMVGGTRDRLDTSLMKAAERPAREQERRRRGCAAIGILPGPARRRVRGRDRRGDQDRGRRRQATGDRGPPTVEALRQVGVLDGQALRVLARYHRPADARPARPRRPRRSPSSSSRRSAS